ncbi:uncharacterized protein LOC116193289 [Punica granatum]|uniref:Uncharacterized protein LOC116193289 n=1 Tax=Punica granatum TaxID=22663 RepID=A0A6P8CA95_PUNGR|nr:uncharacterized protein LOC116193289 [Punica granatum]
MSRKGAVNHYKLCRQPGHNWKTCPLGGKGTTQPDTVCQSSAPIITNILGSVSAERSTMLGNEGGLLVGREGDCSRKNITLKELEVQPKRKMAKRRTGASKIRGKQAAQLGLEFHVCLVQ